ncbi:hypothetical protein LUZ60_016835 [Juncus effusus]|nr:hypothetical protein LUZ60_016835 [Juncus effusus]
MGKQGPCRHCGVTSTPLWRNGPPDKPVLCNACGSRWRTKGSLVNYTPLHVREVLESEELKPVPVKLKPAPVSVPIKKEHQNNHQKIKILPKRKPNPNSYPNSGSNPNLNSRGVVDSEPFSGQNFKRENSHNNNINNNVGTNNNVNNNNNKSSSYTGSAVSYSESCAQYDASDLTGSSQSNVWDPLVPSKKRTGVPRPKPSRVEKLTKDLYTILHETPLSHLSNQSEDDLLYPQHTMDSTDSIEFGSGSVLIRNPMNSDSKSKSKSNVECERKKGKCGKSVEEESEASSVPADLSRSCVSGGNGNGIGNGNGGVQLRGNGEVKVSGNGGGLVIHENAAKRDSGNNEKQPMLRVADLALSSLDLKEIINFESFMKYLTNEEQKQLIKFLPITDTAQPPSSLRSMFSSPQFTDTLNNFQKLLKEGIFNLTLSGANLEDCKTLKKLVLTNPFKSKWVEFYKQIKEKDGQNKNEVKKGQVTSLKRPIDSIDHNHLGSNDTMRSPKRIQKVPSNTDLEANSSTKPKPSETTKGHFGLFLSPADRRSPVVKVPIKYTDDFSDQDLLLDIPNNSSFPEAELLKLVPNEESQSSCGISNYGNKQFR